MKEYGEFCSRTESRRRRVPGSKPARSTILSLSCRQGSISMPRSTCSYTDGAVPTGTATLGTSEATPEAEASLDASSCAHDVQVRATRSVYKIRFNSASSSSPRMSDGMQSRDIMPMGQAHCGSADASVSAISRILSHGCSSVNGELTILPMSSTPSADSTAILHASRVPSGFVYWSADTPLITTSVEVPGYLVRNSSRVMLEDDTRRVRTVTF
ncbi:Uncharacterised protein [Nocardia cyriacigeorgica]|uniref:Uncharacterized protein n=1 Tax=Nocardia cyriacigeorgica TaxID=135487 RepID=A0A4U8WFI2_9NOCA|nr:Uncharacterised protein [Nocardia cyriacigeorgica]